MISKNCQGCSRFVNLFCKTAFPNWFVIISYKVFKKLMSFICLSSSSSSWWGEVGITEGDFWHESWLSINIVLNGHESSVGKPDKVFPFGSSRLRAFLLVAVVALRFLIVHFPVVVVLKKSNKTFDSYNSSN